MIRLFLAFLRLMKVTDDRLRLRVSIHESADEEQARIFWAEVAGVPVGLVAEIDVEAPPA